MQLFGLRTSSRFSFVSHHLLIQQKVLKKIMQESKCSSINNFVKKVLTESELTSNSPFSIDYELYSQYLLRNFPNNVRLSRWGNLSIKRSHGVLKLLDSNFIHLVGFFYFSISLHSWAEWFFSSFKGFPNLDYAFVLKRQTADDVFKGMKKCRTTEFDSE